jgi:hypothetical protein
MPTCKECSKDASFGYTLKGYIAILIKKMEWKILNLKDVRVVVT